MQRRWAHCGAPSLWRSSSSPSSSASSRRSSFSRPLWALSFRRQDLPPTSDKLRRRQRRSAYVPRYGNVRARRRDRVAARRIGLTSQRKRAARPPTTKDCKATIRLAGRPVWRQLIGGGRHATSILLASRSSLVNSPGSARLSGDLAAASAAAMVAHSRRFVRLANRFAAGRKTKPDFQR